MKKALVFGGAFNPPTRAHIDLAYEAKEMTQADCVIFVPTKSTYIKDTQRKEMVFTNDDRLSFLNILAKTRKWMEVCDYEIKSDHQPRTYETLHHLKQEGYDCKLLFGYDKLIELETGWLFVPEIMKEFGVVCFNRNHSNAKEYIKKDSFLKPFEPYIKVLNVPNRYHEISSTSVRKTLKEMETAKKKLEKNLPEELMESILERI